MLSLWPPRHKFLRCLFEHYRDRDIWTSIRRVRFVANSRHRLNASFFAVMRLPLIPIWSQNLVIVARAMFSSTSSRSHCLLYSYQQIWRSYMLDIMFLGDVRSEWIKRSPLSACQHRASTGELQKAGGESAYISTLVPSSTTLAGGIRK
jgi:hypothetical protein